MARRLDIPNDRQDIGGKLRRLRLTGHTHTAPAGSAHPIAFRIRRPPGPPRYALKSPSTPGGDNIRIMRSKWVDLMIRGGILACAEIAYNRNKSPSNFNTMCRARVMYEAAVERIGRDVVAKSMLVEDAMLRRARLRPLFPRPRPSPNDGADGHFT